MSSNASAEEKHTEVIYESLVEESSEEPPMDEWSSLIIEVPEENAKRILHEQGLYSPGSGEMCAKYVEMSTSSILEHPYYNYPAVKDPGILKALLDPEVKAMFSDDGQELYMTLCKEMNQCPVMTFFRGLLSDKIDLRYYTVNPFGVRAMALALQYNKKVKTFNLTYSFLNDDACIHLGEMLISNSNLSELILAGCRIGPSGAKNLFAGLHLNRGLRLLNLDKNQIGDLGIDYFAATVFRAISLREISLSYNEISGKAANVLAETFETYNKFTHINLSWNNLYAPIGGTCNLLSRLSENKVLQDLNLSWNSLTGVKIGNVLKAVLKAPNLQVLDLSNNRLSGEAVQTFVTGLNRAKKLITLNLSYNPMTPEDALKLLQKTKLNTVKVQNVLMENVFVDGSFLVLLELIKSINTKKNMIITYGGIKGDYQPIGPDMRDLVLNRVEFLTTRGKKRKFNLALTAMQMLKDNMDIMPAKSFADALVEAGAVLDSDLVDEIVDAFSGPKSAKSKTISISLLVEYIHRKWPDRKLPPTPPPEPELPLPEIDLKSSENMKKNVKLLI